MFFSTTFALLQEAAGNTQGAGGAQPQAPLWMNVVPLVLIFGLVWFMLIRPERNARKKQEELLNNLAKGDKVVTRGGLIGTIAALQDDYLTLQVDEGVRLKFERSAIRGKTNDPAEAK